MCPFQLSLLRGGGSGNQAGTSATFVPLARRALDFIGLIWINISKLTASHTCTNITHQRCNEIEDTEYMIST